MGAIPGGNLVDGSLTLSGASQQSLAANHGRQMLFIENVSAANDAWFNFGTAAVADIPSIRLAPGAVIAFDAPAVVPTAAVFVIGTAGQKVVVKEY